MTVPLTKVSNHILVLQILIVLDTQTDRQTFHENPHFVSVKGKTKKAVAFGLFVYPKCRGCSRAVGIDKTVKQLKKQASWLLPLVNFRIR